MKRFYTSLICLLSLNALATQVKDIPITTDTDTIINGSSLATNLGGLTIVTAAGTAAALTGSAATLDFGTTDPIITISAAGTYAIWYSVNAESSGATLAAIRNITFKLRRTNNTAADLTSSSSTLRAQIMTLLTSNVGQVSFGPVVYVTTNANDSIALQGIIDVVPSAGSVTCNAAQIVAMRIK